MDADERHENPRRADTALCVSFRESKGVSPVGFNVTPETCVTLTGPSGVGKTTMLRAIADLIPHEGAVSLGSRDQASYPAPEWRKRVMYVASDAGWWAPTVADHMAKTPDLSIALNRVGLSETLLDRSPQDLSSGERQRMGLLRAMLQKPGFLLLDEPTSALDDDTTNEVEALLTEFKQAGGGIVLVTHDRGQVDRMADSQVSIYKVGT